MAKRYLDFFEVEREKELDTYIKHYENFNHDKLDDKVINNNRKKINRLKKKYGDDFTNGDYGWANTFFKNKKTNFRDILEYSEERCMLLYYKFSCQFVHGSCKNIFIDLANINGIKIKSDEYEKITGDTSNIGFSEPLQLTMYSFLNVFASLISLNPEIDYIINFLFLGGKIKEIAEKCIAKEKEIIVEEKNKKSFKNNKP